jgi:hypothetical protein
VEKFDNVRKQIPMLEERAAHGRQM